MKKIFRSVFHLFGIDIVKLRPDPVFHPDMEEEFQSHFRACSPYSMTSLLNMYALFRATCYLVESKLAGDIVECGVWKGGSTMLSVKTMLKRGETDRHVYLYDTFAGMPEPADVDVSFSGEPAHLEWSRVQRDRYNEWCYAPVEAVRANMEASGYPMDKVRIVEGKVEDTIPNMMPERISLLRIDTDWYSSTKHILTHLYPRVVKGGVVIIDDYGHWMGARKAVDEFLGESDVPLLLNKIDYSARIGVKVQD